MDKDVQRAKRFAILTIFEVKDVNDMLFVIDTRHVVGVLGFLMIFALMGITGFLVGRYFTYNKRPFLTCALAGLIATLVQSLTGLADRFFQYVTIIAFLTLGCGTEMGTRTSLRKRDREK